MLNPFEHDQCAFAGGKLWIVPNPINYLASADWRFYLCDIEQRKVLGLMSNAVPVWLNADQTKVLCVQPTLPKSRFKMRLDKLINQVTFGRIKIIGLCS